LLQKDRHRGVEDTPDLGTHAQTPQAKQMPPSLPPSPTEIPEKQTRLNGPTGSPLDAGTGTCSGYQAFLKAGVRAAA